MAKQGLYHHEVRLGTNALRERERNQLSSTDCPALITPQPGDNMSRAGAR